MRNNREFACQSFHEAASVEQRAYIRVTPRPFHLRMWPNARTATHAHAPEIRIFLFHKIPQRMQTLSVGTTGCDASSEPIRLHAIARTCQPVASSKQRSIHVIMYVTKFLSYPVIKINPHAHGQRCKLEENHMHTSATTHRLCFFEKIGPKGQNLHIM